MQQSIHLPNFKVIVGLGNPGLDYARTRHNAGFMFVDFLKEEWGGEAWKAEPKFFAEIAKAQGVLLAKPTTFMNNSGRAVRAILDFYKLYASDILVAFDDLDLELGNFKLTTTKFPKVHNGLNSVRAHLGEGVALLRLGVDARTVKGNKLISGHDYSLSNFTHKEREKLQRTFAQILVPTLN